MTLEQMCIRILNSLFPEASGLGILILNAAFANPPSATRGILNVMAETPCPRWRISDAL
jgi:hypothetical protein